MKSGKSTDNFKGNMADNFKSLKLRHDIAASTFILNNPESNTSNEIRILHIMPIMSPDPTAVWTAGVASPARGGL